MPFGNGVALRVFSSTTSEVGTPQIAGDEVKFMVARGLPDSLPICCFGEKSQGIIPF